MRRALILGSGGQVGRALLSAQWPTTWRIVGLPRGRADISRRAEIDAAIALADPDIVINAAGYTDPYRVAAEPREAWAANCEGPRLLAAACERRHLPLIHLSCDEVFDGDTDRPWREDDAIGPASLLGAMKAAGEVAVRERVEHHVILRSSGLYSSAHEGAVGAVLRAAQQRREIVAAADRHFAPTGADDVARAVVALAERAVGGLPLWGTWHWSGTAETTPHGFAAMVVASAGIGCRVLPEVPSAARRSHRSTLDSNRLVRALGFAPRPWQEGIAALFADTRPLAMAAE